MEIQVVSEKRCQVVDLTAKVRAKCKEWGKSGVVHIYCPHTTAGIAVNENADPTVKADYLAHVEKLIPLDPAFTHTEGNADAHIKSILTGSSASVPVLKGKLMLGRWQGVFFMEYDGPRNRTVRLTFLASAE